MAPRPFVLKESNWKTVRDTEYQVAVLPWGATEAHNLHLPYGTDIIESEQVAIAAAALAWEQGTKCMVLPAVPFGVNTGQLDIKLCINMNPSTQMALLRDVLDSLAAQDIGKFVILNGHGGNDFKQILRELAPQFPDMLLCTANWYQAEDWNRYFDEPGDHGGEMETSVMLHIAADWVLPLAEAGDGAARRFKVQALNENWAWSQRQWSQVTADTGVGNPKRATAEKGRVYLEKSAQRIAAFLVDLARADICDLYESPP